MCRTNNNEHYAHVIVTDVMMNNVMIFGSIRHIIYNIKCAHVCQHFFINRGYDKFVFTYCTL